MAARILLDREQLYGAAGQMRRDFDRQANGQPTAGGWKEGETKNSLDPLAVTPSSKVAALLLSYTPWVGERWGGKKLIGGNALFCEVWKQYGFIIACKSGNTTPLSISGPDTPTDGSCYTASGGAPHYTWSIDKGKIDTSGMVSGLSDQCGTATVTVKDACGATQQKTVTLSTAEISISGPDTSSDGSQYTATGGKAPYSWTISKGSITQDGIVTVSGQCGTAIVTATDACNNTGLKEVKMPSGRWVLTSSQGSSGTTCTIIEGVNKTEYAVENCCGSGTQGCNDCRNNWIRWYGYYSTNIPSCFIQTRTDCCDVYPCGCRCILCTATVGIRTYEWRCQ